MKALDIFPLISGNNGALCDGDEVIGEVRERDKYKRIEEWGYLLLKHKEREVKAVASWNYLDIRIILQ